MARWLPPTTSLWLSLLLLGGAAACGDNDTRCATAVEASTATLDLGALCVRDLSARALVDGVWVPAELEHQEQDGVHLLVATSAGEAQAFELVLPAVDADRMLQQGYQSWSFSGAVTLGPRPTLAADGAPATLVAVTGDVTDEERGVSYGSSVLGSARGPYLVAGAASTLRATTGISAWREDGHAEVSILYGAARETLRPDADGRSRSEPIVFLADADPGAGLDRLRAVMQAHLPADAHVPQRPPGGWFSWNERYADVDAPFLRDHIDIVRRELLPLGMPLVELDDGWMPSWGDWTSNERFPDGVESLAGEIDAAGLEAGIWLAPFLVDVDSSLGRTIDPGLLVRDERGEPLRHHPTGGTRDFYVLDGSNPAAMASVTDAIAGLRAAGYRFFKLDFLYAGALPGQRHSDVTGVAAMRNGIRLLRVAMGEDAVLNACGVPIHPILGLTDSLRVGPDTAFDGFSLALPLVTSAARSYAARSYLFPMVWPDGDQTQLRGDYSEVVARMSATVAALAGPAYSLGDDLRQLDAARRAIGTDAAILDLAASDTPARPIDLMDEPADDVILSPTLESVITPDYTRAPPPTRFSAVGASGTRYQIELDWSAPYGVSIREE